MLKLINRMMFGDTKAEQTISPPESVKEPKPEPVKEESQCFCHKASGKPGWCGVAGGGVPACDH